MARPGTETTVSDSGPARGSDADSSAWFIAGTTEKGAVGASIVCRNPAEFRRKCGSRTVNAQVVNDVVDQFYREGGRVVYIGRTVGPAAAAAFVVLNDAGAAATLRVEALNPGAWGNTLNIEVVDGGGGSFVLVVSDDNDGELERSPALADKAAAFGWAANSEYIRLIDQASANDPAVVGPQGLAGGNDDLAGIDDTVRAAALNVHGRPLGMGQCSIPGATTLAAHSAVLAHADANNRRAILDGPDTASDTTLRTTAANDRTTAGAPANRDGGVFAPWIVIPGVAPGTTRTVPPCGLVAGRIAAVDAAFSPDDPAAGDLGHSLYAIDVSQPEWDDDTRTALNDAGVNVIRQINGDVVIYGWRTLADPINDPDWVGLAESRTIMVIDAVLDAVGERFVLKKNDGRKHAISKFGGELVGALIPFWEDDALFGATPSEAFSVDVGDTVNTPETIEAGEFNAEVGVRVSPTGELVKIKINKKRITEAVS